MSWRWFRSNFQLESFLRSIRQESHINHRSEVPGDNFHEWAMTSSKFFIVESFLRSIRQESHIIHRSELSGDHFHEWATISSKFSCREFLEIFKTREPLQLQNWAIWRPFSWVGVDFVQICNSRVSCDLLYKTATSFTEVSYMETIFMSGRWFWKWSSDSSLLWMMWLSCIKDLEKLSTWKFRRNHRPLMKIVSI